AGKDRERIEVPRNRDLQDRRSARGGSVEMVDGKDRSLEAGDVRRGRRQVMIAPTNKKSEFIAAFSEAIENKTFIRISLGKFRGQGEPSKAVATLVLLKDVPHLKLVTSLARKDETKTFSINDGINHIKSKIGDTYLSTTLFAASGDVTLTYSRKREPQLVKGKATSTSAPPATEHNRTKTYLVAPDRPYLKALQVSDADGRVKPSMQGKYRQICHIIEIVDGLLKDADGGGADEPLSIVDIGSGKGYLTFALYDHIATTLGRSCRMTGIEVRDDLVAFCNELARKLDFSGLEFEAAGAQRTSAKRADI